MLSQENINKLVMSGLYEMTPEKKGDFWCRNWTFIVSHNDSNNKYFMTDTYFKNHHVELTDNNFNDFIFVMDFQKVKQVDEKVFDEYQDEKKYRVAVDSGGWRYAKYYVLQDTKPSRENKRKILQDKINHYKLRLEWAERDLIELDSNKNYE